MKVAISGKGGTGKTAVSALLAAELVRRGYRVTAIDADPNPCLGPCLGLPPDKARPLSEMGEEIEARVGGSGGFIRLNPRVDDLVERVAVIEGPISLIVAGAISRGGAGCACPQGVLLRSLLDHIVLESDEVVIIDLEAGLEHLGRRSAQAADALLVVVDPTRASVDTAVRIRRLASEIGIRRVLAVANRIRDEADASYLSARLDDVELVGWIPYSVQVAQAERDGRAVGELMGDAREAVMRLVDELLKRCAAPAGTGAAAAAAVRAGR